MMRKLVIIAAVALLCATGSHAQENPVIISQPQCQQPAETGPCRGYMPSWYYDADAKQCQSFIYGGCGGNDNRFSSEEDCKAACGSDRTTTAPTVIVKVPTCQQPIESGMCLAYMPSYAFDAKTKKCTKFIYGGCGGNDNRFATRKACQAECLQPKLCKLPVNPPEEMTCLAYIPSWGYNSTTNKCTKFIYGGCGGNKNRFTSKAACEKKCKL